MPERPRIRPSDPNQLGKLIVDVSTGTVEDIPVAKQKQKNPAAVALGALGGAKGGKARAASLSKAKRKAIARKAARARWHSPAK
jgi:hypothetical protein